MEKFENKRVAVEVTAKPDCLVELHVHVTPAACQEAQKEAIKAISQRVSLPGFRKGKAPEAMIKKNYSASIDEEWRNIVINIALREGINLTSIYPWNRDKISPPTVKNFSLEDGCEFRFAFEREPQIPEVKREEISLTKEEAKPITEKEIDASIEQLKKNHAIFEECDEAIAEGSFCRIDLESLSENPPVQLVADHRIEIEKGSIANWLTQLLLGKKAGESAEGQTASSTENPSFQPMPVRVTVKAVEKRTLPEDDTLLNAVKIESMDQLRTQTKERLENEEAQRVDQALKDQLWALISEKYPFAIPSSLLQAETEVAVRQMIQERQEEGQTQEQIVSQEKEIEHAAKDVAFKRLHAFFIARAVAMKARKLPQEKEVQQRASDLRLWDALVKGQLPSKEVPSPQELAFYRNRAFVMLVQEKAEDYLLAPLE
ncbi:MAG: trigger factor [Verrucomicrobia bacterium]|nr:trigger factor [Verrucomicrobiota bacterium]